MAACLPLPPRPRIGLTGGIASGKSTVARLLAAKGAVIIDADAIVRELQQPGGAALAGIVSEFGRHAGAGFNPGPGGPRGARLW